jgi:hypothetical protein
VGPGAADVSGDVAGAAAATPLLVMRGVAAAATASASTSPQRPVNMRAARSGSNSYVRHAS